MFEEWQVWVLTAVWIILAQGCINYGKWLERQDWILTGSCEPYTTKKGGKFWVVMPESQFVRDYMLRPKSDPGSAIIDMNNPPALADTQRRLWEQIKRLNNQRDEGE